MNTILNTELDEAALNVLRNYPITKIIKEMYSEHYDNLSKLENKLTQDVKTAIDGYKHVIDTCPVNEDKKQEFYNNVTKIMEAK